ncbi:flagellar assembly protein FliW [Paenibacillus sp. JNUCC32]|uniref:flagellar assembly protein FliW n=1 Tax=Paenibacillus sp. JNUCC32 TaxID=2777984 RepID=UPI00178826FE|nr:flagellar assembly protein FliW [Paenibacillus sp. JNUCC-32]QOT09817.1 flagellar assembly protein FliW [Paenibacillus sp. JNUCC-32]
MIVNTKRFGAIEVDEKEVITFRGPILGFGGLQKYVFIPSENNEHPFGFLQSIEDENLTFIVTDPFTFFSEYEFQLDPHWIGALDIQDKEYIQVMVIVTIRSAEDVTCNLRAPIVLNRAKNIAAQIVLDQGSHTTKQPLSGGGRKGGDSDVNSVSK